MKKIMLFILIILFVTFLVLGVTKEFVQNQLPENSICYFGPDANGFFICHIAGSPPSMPDNFIGFYNVKPIFFKGTFIGLEKFPTTNPFSAIEEGQIIDVQINRIEKKANKILKYFKKLFDFFKIKI